MLMSAAVYMDPSTTTTPPWLLHHGGFASAAPSSSRNHRIITKNKKRRPRPSRRLPTTYINADAASFRRMVQHVTGASSDQDLAPPQPQEGQELKMMNASELFFSRPVVPIKRTMGTEMLLPTLDTSAFLATGDGSSSSAGGASCCNTATAGTGFPTLESWDHHAPLF